MTDALFDASRYGEETKRRSPPKPRELIRSDGHWYLLCRPMKPPSTEAHRVKHWFTDHPYAGAVVTRCDQEGRPLRLEPKVMVLPCRECQKKGDV